MKNSGPTNGSVKFQTQTANIAIYNKDFNKF